MEELTLSAVVLSDKLQVAVENGSRHLIGWVQLFLRCCMEDIPSIVLLQAFGYLRVSLMKEVQQPSPLLQLFVNIFSDLVNSLRPQAFFGEPI